VRGLQNAQQHGRRDRANRRDLAEPFPDRVFLTLGEQIPPHLLSRIGCSGSVHGSCFLQVRIGEALGLKVGEHVSTDCRTLYIRQSVWNGKEQDPKTDNAVRDIDVCSDLAAMLMEYIGNRTDGFLFHSGSGGPLLQRNILRDGLNPVLTELGLKQDDKAFHSFRRFRVMHLRKSRVPWDLEKFWIGHADKDVTDKYAVQLKEDLDWRKDVAEKTGLGFVLPPSIENSVGQLGQLNLQQVAAEEAA